MIKHGTDGVQILGCWIMISTIFTDTIHFCQQIVGSSAAFSFSFVVLVLIVIILVVPIVVVSSSQQVRPMITALTITIAVVASLTIAVVASLTIAVVAVHAVVATSIFIRVVRLLISLSTIERK